MQSFPALLTVQETALVVAEPLQASGSPSLSLPRTQLWQGQGQGQALDQDRPRTVGDGRQADHHVDQLGGDVLRVPVNLLSACFEPRRAGRGVAFAATSR